MGSGIDWSDVAEGPPGAAPAFDPGKLANDGFADDTFLPRTTGPQESIGSGIDWSDLQEPAPQEAAAATPPPPTDDPSPFVTGARVGYEQTIGLAGALSALVGDKLDIDPMRRWGIDVYEGRMDRAAELNEQTVSSYDQVEGFGDAVDYVSYHLGSFVSQMAPTLLSGGVGAFAGRVAIQKAAKELMERETERMVSEGVAKDQAVELAKEAAEAKIKQGQWLGGAAGAGTTGIGLSTGEIGGSLYDETGQLYPEVAASFGVAAGLLDTFTPLRVLDRLGLGNSFVEALQRSPTIDIITSGVMEGGTEMGQFMLEEFAQKWVNDQYEILDEQGKVELINSGLAGLIGGSAIQAGTRVGQDVFRQDEDALRREAEGMALKYRRALDRAAEEARRQAEAEGGDSLAQELAANSVYLGNEDPVALNPSPAPAPEGPPEGTVNYNPYQQDMQQPTSFDVDGNPVVPQPQRNPYAPPEPEPIDWQPFQPEEPGSSLGLVPQEDGDAIPYAPPVQEDRTDALAQPIQDRIDEQTYREVGLDAAEEDTDAPGELPEPLPPVRQEQDEADLSAIDEDISTLEASLPERPKVSHKSNPSPEYDLLENIAILGGIDREEARKEGIDPAEFERKAGSKWIFRKTGGRSLDDLAGSLDELGFFEGEGEYSANSLLDKVSRALGGEEIVSPRSAARQVQPIIEQELDDLARKRDELLQPDLDDPPPALVDRMDDPAVQLGYDLEEAAILDVPDADLDAAMDAAATVEAARKAVRRLINARRQDRSPGGTQDTQGSPRDSETDTQLAQQQEAASDGQRSSRSEQDQLDIFSEPERPKSSESGTGLDRDTAYFQELVNRGWSARDALSKVQARARREGRSVGLDAVDQGRESEPDLFGGPTEEEVAQGQLDQARQEKDERRNPPGERPAEGSDSGIFSDASRQTDLQDAVDQVPWDDPDTLPLEELEDAAARDLLPGDPDGPVQGPFIDRFSPFTLGTNEDRGSVPLMADMVKDPEYQARAKGRQLRIERLSPASYVRQALDILADRDGLKGAQRRRFLTAHFARLMNRKGQGADRDKVVSMAQAMRDGAKYEMPWLNRKDLGQEGLHRAAAAAELGLVEIPVAIIEPTSVSSESPAAKLQESVSRKQAEKALKKLEFTEDVLDEDGNVVEITETGWMRLRALDKRLKQLDKLLECVA